MGIIIRRSGSTGRAARMASAPKAHHARWTATDVASLVRMRSSGLPLAEIAQQLGRTYEAVAYRVRPHYAEVRRKMHWSAEEVEVLRALCRRSMPNKAIAATMGLPLRRVVSARAYHIRAAISKRTRFKHADLDKIETMRKEGRTLGEIANSMGFPPSTLHKVIKQYLGPSPHFWSDAEIAKASRLRAAGQTAADIKKHLPKRTASSIYGRPVRSDVRVRKFTPSAEEETATLLEQRRQGISVAEISTRMPGRSFRAVSVRWSRIVTGKIASYSSHAFSAAARPGLQNEDQVGTVLHTRQLSTLRHNGQAALSRPGRRTFGSTTRVAITPESVQSEDQPVLRGRRDIPRGWTAAENTRFLSLYGAGKKYRDIANQLGRSVRAIRYKVAMENLKRAEHVPWSEQDLNTLRDLSARGMGPRMISATMGVDYQRVRRARNYYAVPAVRKESRWKRSHVKKIEKLRHDGLTTLEIAAVMSIGTDTVHRLVQQYLGPTARTKRKWTESESAEVARLKDQGLNVGAIAKRLPGRTASAVKTHITRKGMAPARLWTPHETQTLTELRSRGLSTREIQAIMPNRTYAGIKNKARELKAEGAKHSPSAIDTDSLPKEDDSSITG